MSNIKCTKCGRVIIITNATTIRIEAEELFCDRCLEEDRNTTWDAATLDYINETAEDPWNN